MEFILQFAINTCDLIIFWYYLNTFRTKKLISMKKGFLLIMILALVRTGVWVLDSSYANLLISSVSLFFISLLFEKKKWLKLINIISFISIGILSELIGMVLLYTTNPNLNGKDGGVDYIIAMLVIFIKGNIIFFICKLCKSKNFSMERFPKQIIGGLIVIFGFSSINYCFIISIMTNTKIYRNVILCISLIVSKVVTYCFMLYMLDRFNVLLKERHEDELYRNEMHFKEIYYSELEKRNEYIQNLKHDLKNKVYGLVYYAKEQDLEQLSVQINMLNKEIEKIEANSYCINPIVDTVLRIKMGVAKAEGIETCVNVQIPNKITLDYGDIGVLYGNLLDNAIEACLKLPKEDRFIRVENKMVEEKMLLIIQNTKVSDKNEELITQKQNKYKHGRGIKSVRRVVEKYNGDIYFIDRIEGFEVIASLYGVEEVKD